MGGDQNQSDVLTMGFFGLMFVSIDALCGWVAYRLDGKRVKYPVHLPIAQRFIYRKITCPVGLRPLSSAIAGRRAGWGKLDRTGRVALTHP